MFAKIDLENILRNGIEKPKNIYSNLEQIYANDKERDYFILRNIFSREGTVADFSMYDKADIFSIDDIKSLCIEYNLRFLDSYLFKGLIPKDALNKVKYIEDTTGQELTKFKIIAPAKRFELLDENADPLIFTDLGNDKYLFIHKWGSDMNWFQKVVSIPTRNYDNLVVSALVISAILSLFIPNSWITNIADISYFNFYRVLFFFWVSIISFAFTFYYWFSFRKTVTEDGWNCKTD